MTKQLHVIPEIIVPKAEKSDDDDNNKTPGSLNSGNGNDPTACSHVMWSHNCDPEDFGHALDFLSLCMDPDDAQDYVDDLQDDADKGKIEHYKVVDIFRAAKCTPATDDHAQEMVKKMNSGTKVAPAMLVRGEKSKTGAHPLIADGFHRLSAAMMIDPEMCVPCVVADK
jgi:hypothetical protein